MKLFVPNIMIESICFKSKIVSAECKILGRYTLVVRNYILCWTLGPIGGPAFSSQTLLWWPLECNHNLPWVKPYLQVFPPFPKLGILHILQVAPKYTYSLAWKIQTWLTFIKQPNKVSFNL